MTSPLPPDAASLKDRIFAGETIPLEELLAFIQSTEKTILAEKREKKQPPSENEIDFF